MALWRSLSGYWLEPTSEREDPESACMASPLTPDSRVSEGPGVLLRRESSDPLKQWELLWKFRHACYHPETSIHLSDHTLKLF